MRTLEPQRVPLTMLLICGVGLALLWSTQRRNAFAFFETQDTAALSKKDVKPATGASISVRVVSPPSMMIRQWESRRLTWTVTGSSERMGLRLQNKTPQIATMQGGNTQIVTTSGGVTNTASVFVTGVRVGEVQIETALVESSQPTDTARERQLAMAFRVSLKEIADKLEAAARDIPVIPADPPRPRTVRRDDAFRLLDRCESSIRKALPQPEFAPFRDAVAGLVADAKNSIDGRSFYRMRASARNGIELVRNEAPSGATIEEALFRAVMARLVAIIRGASDTSPVDTLCFLTTPEGGATVVLYPPSFPTDRHMLRTASRVTLYLGRYAVQINRKDAGFVDVLLDRQRVVECSMSAAADTQACRLIASTIDRCP